MWESNAFIINNKNMNKHLNIYNRHQNLNLQCSYQEKINPFNQFQNTNQKNKSNLRNRFHIQEFYDFKNIFEKMSYDVKMQKRKDPMCMSSFKIGKRSSYYQSCDMESMKQKNNKINHLKQYNGSKRNKINRDSCFGEINEFLMNNKDQNRFESIFIKENKFIFKRFCNPFFTSSTDLNSFNSRPLNEHEQMQNPQLQHSDYPNSMQKFIHSHQTLDVNDLKSLKNIPMKNQIMSKNMNSVETVNRQENKVKIFNSIKKNFKKLNKPFIIQTEFTNDSELNENNKLKIINELKSEISHFQNRYQNKIKCQFLTQLNFNMSIQIPTNNLYKKSFKTLIHNSFGFQNGLKYPFLTQLEEKLNSSFNSKFNKNNIEYNQVNIFTLLNFQIDMSNEKFHQLTYQIKLKVFCMIFSKYIKKSKIVSKYETFLDHINIEKKDEIESKIVR